MAYKKAITILRIYKISCKCSLLNLLLETTLFIKPKLKINLAKS